MSILSVRNLTKHYPVREGLLARQTGAVRAVDGVSFDLREGETLGLVGESGSGKSTAARTLLHLEEPTGGEVRFDGERVGEQSRAERRRFRRRAQMVFQDPTESFDPRMTVGQAVAEPLRIHGMDDRKRREELVADALERVDVPPADADRYPHEFSGGQQQRIALARAIVLNPDVLVADEPVSALDVSVQASVLDLLSDLQDRFDLSMLFISHDMSVVREICDRVAVMYAGEIVEVGPVEEVFADPAHPYTEALLAAVPEPDPSAGRVAPLDGDVPDPADPPAGCRFHPRCPRVIQPEGLDLPDDEWHALIRLRDALERGSLDPESAREAVEAEQARPDGGTVRSYLREEYDLPPELADDDAERVLSEALSSFAEGDPGAACERLASTFETPCERSTPEQHDVGEGRRSACHLHD